MKSSLHRSLWAASALALALAGAPLMAQTPGTAAPAANDNAAPLSAPDTPASRAQALPNSFADLVDEVSPAVVMITTTATVSTPARGFSPFPDGSPFGDLFRDFGFDGNPGGRGGPPFAQRGPQRSSALGSGFVIAPDGYVVTNNHVIEGADEIEIEFRDGARRKAEVVGTDPKTDVALLKVDATDLPYVEFGDSDQARVGDWVLALGNPLGQGFSASTGIVSARNRELSGTYDDYIQTDAAINRGNSGGPLFDMDGKVIGVNTAILSPNGGSIGIGFSMASNVVSKVVAQLRDYGETRRGYLGVTVQDVTEEMVQPLGLSRAEGALVNNVPDGPASEAGIQAGDVITEFAGRPVANIRDLVRRVADSPVGEAVPLTVLRNGEAVELEITLGRRETAEAGGAQGGPDTGNQPEKGRAEDLLGMRLTPLTPEIAGELGVSPDSAGLVVEEVDPTGKAADQGLMPGDIITTINRQPVASLADLQRLVGEAQEAGHKTVLAMIRRGSQPMFVALAVE